MSGRSKILCIAGLAVLAFFVTSLPWERQSSGLTEFLYTVGDRQSEIADSMTSDVVSGVEGDVVGEHEVDGSNWSIPNILRHLLGG